MCEDMKLLDRRQVRHHQPTQHTSHRLTQPSLHAHLDTAPETSPPEPRVRFPGPLHLTGAGLHACARPSPPAVSPPPPRGPALPHEAEPELAAAHPSASQPPPLNALPAVGSCPAAPPVHSPSMTASASPGRQQRRVV